MIFYKKSSWLTTIQFYITYCYLADIDCMKNNYTNNEKLKMIQPKSCLLLLKSIQNRQNKLYEKCRLVDLFTENNSIKLY